MSRSPRCSRHSRARINEENREDNLPKTVFFAYPSSCWTVKSEKLLEKVSTLHFCGRANKINTVESVRNSIFRKTVENIYARKAEGVCGFFVYRTAGRRRRNFSLKGKFDIETATHTNKQTIVVKKQCEVGWNVNGNRHRRKLYRFFESLVDTLDVARSRRSVRVVFGQAGTFVYNFEE